MIRRAKFCPVFEGIEKRLLLIKNKAISFHSFNDKT